MSNLFKKLITISFAFILACAFWACKTEEGPVDFDVKYSVNIAKPQKGWPIIKKLTETKKAVYEKYGTPDAFRIYWTHDGRIQSKDDVRKELKRRQNERNKELPDHSWIYLDKNIEVYFDKNNKAMEKPLTDMIKIIVNYGDPEEVSRVDKNSWKYYSKGKMFTFSKSGKIIEEKDFPAMGGYFSRH